MISKELGTIIDQYRVIDTVGPGGQASNKKQVGSIGQCNIDQEVGLFINGLDSFGKVCPSRQSLGLPLINDPDRFEKASTSRQSLLAGTHIPLGSLVVNESAGFPLNALQGSNFGEKRMQITESGPEPKSDPTTYGPVGPVGKPVIPSERDRFANVSASSWAGLFKPSSQDSGLAQTTLGLSIPDSKPKPKSPVSMEDFRLEFVDHGVKEDSLVLKVPIDLTVAGKEEWSTTLVGRFLGKKLPYSLVTSVTERFWGKEGLIDTLATESGCFFFIFSNGETRDAALEGGPWFVAGQPLLLRP